MGTLRRAATNVNSVTDVMLRAFKVAVFTFLSAPIVNAIAEGSAADFNALLAIARAAVAAGLSVIINAILLWAQPE